MKTDSVSNQIKPVGIHHRLPVACGETALVGVLKQALRRLSQGFVAGVAGAVGGWAQGVPLQIEPSGNQVVILRWPDTGSNYRLERAYRLGDLPDWIAQSTDLVREGGDQTARIQVLASQQYFRLQPAGEPEMTRVASTSPSMGESGVSPTREVIIRWTRPLAPDAVPDEEGFFAKSAGRRILSRSEISKDRRSSTLHFLEPLPPSSVVEATWQLDGAKDVDGGWLDPDGDGAPGGARVVRFVTASTAGIPGTAVTARVFAAEPVVVDGRTNNVPLAGVIVTVDGQEDRMRAITDADGWFLLNPCPVGEFFVHIDGRLAEGSQWPSGSYYPFIGKTFLGVAGRTNPAPGGAAEIYLPHIQAGTLTRISATQTTTVTIPASVVGSNPALADVRITVPPNALYSNDGARGGMVGIAPVPPDRLPSPLPPNLFSPLVITIQTDGPSNFDQPVPVRFPNLPNPVTGRTLAPGGKSTLWSFNHDTGRWEPQGSMTVSVDGRYLETDPGVGVLQPGWHAPGGGSPSGGGGGDGDGPCGPEQQAMNDAMVACALSLGTGVLLDILNTGGFGCVLSLANASVATAVACQDPQNNCVGSLLYNGAFGAAGCAPPPFGTSAGVAQCIWEIGNAMGDLLFCQLQNQPPNPPQPILSSALRRGQFRRAQAGETPLDQSIAAADEVRQLHAVILGNEQWLEIIEMDRVGSLQFVNALIAALDRAGDEGAQVSVTERAALLAMPVPRGATRDLLNGLVDRFDRIARGGLTPSEQGAIEEAAARVQSTVARLTAQGWTGIGDGLIATLRDTSTRSDDSMEGDVSPRRLLYRLEDLASGAVQTGEIPAQGGISNIILNENTDHVIHLLDPETFDIGIAAFRTAGPGRLTTIPRAWLTRIAGTDQDQDGLPDYAEGIVGTDPAKPDTDGDGTLDSAEVRNGSDPLDGLGPPVGILANVGLSQPLTGGVSSAVGLDFKDPLAFIASGYGGVAVFDVSDTLKPVRIVEFGLDGYTTGVAYSPEARRAAVAIGVTVNGSFRQEIQWVDFADLTAPRLLGVTEFDGRILHARDGLMFSGSGQTFKLMIYDAFTREERGQVNDLNGHITGILRTHDHLFVATSANLSVYDTSLPTPRRLGRLNGNFSASHSSTRARMILDGTTLFIAKARGGVSVDVSDPQNPLLLGTPAAASLSWRDVGLNGGGIAVALRAFQAVNDSFNSGALLQLFDVHQPSDMTRALGTIQSLAVPSDIAVVGGRVLIADGRAGLTVINPVGPEVQSQPPVLSYDPAGIDLDASRPGIQVAAGTRVSIRPGFLDNTQFDRATLIVDGIPVASTRTYPVELMLDVPSPCAANCPDQQMEIVALDGAGNSVRLGPWTLDSVAVIAAP